MQDGRTDKEADLGTEDQSDSNSELVDSDIQQEEIMKVNPILHPFPDMLPLSNKLINKTNLKEVKVTEPNNFGVENIKELYGTLAKTTFSAIEALGDGFQVKDLSILIPIVPELFSLGSKINEAKQELGDVITKEEEESIIAVAVDSMAFGNNWDKELVGLITKQIVGIQQIWHNRAMKSAELKANLKAGS